MRFAIIGTDVISTSRVEAIAKNSRAELVAVCDMNKDKACKLCRKARDQIFLFGL